MLEKYQRKENPYPNKQSINLGLLPRNGLKGQPVMLEQNFFHKVVQLCQERTDRISTFYYWKNPHQQRVFNV